MKKKLWSFNKNWSNLILREWNKKQIPKCPTIISKAPVPLIQIKTKLAIPVEISDGIEI